VVEAAGAPVVLHCCAPAVPLDVVRASGAAAVALDVSLVDKLDPLGEAIDAGLGLFAGATGTSKAVADQVRGVWRQLGFAEQVLPDQVVVTPTCGLAGSSPAEARRALTAVREAAQRLQEA